MKVLLVDDHAVVRQGYASLLRALLPEVQVSEACDGEQALAQNSIFGIELPVGGDAAPPGLPGIGLAEQEKQHPRDVDRRTEQGSGHDRCKGASGNPSAHGPGGEG